MKYKFCPECGKRNSIKKITPTRYQCANCNADFWKNPKAANAVILCKNNQILYAVRKFKPHKGKYEFPGGYIDYGEDPYDSCIREIKEELGLEVNREDLHLLTAYLSPHSTGDTIDLIFILSKWDGKIEARDDVERLEWKPMSFMQNSEFRQPYFDLENRLKEYFKKN